MTDYRASAALDEPDLRVESRFKNAVLRRELLKMFGPAYRGSGPNLKAASESIGVSLGGLSSLLCLRESPLCSERTERRYYRRYRLMALKVSDALGVPPEQLFPDSLYALKLPNVAVREFHSPQILSLQECTRMAVAPLQLVAAEQAERGERVRDALYALTPREEKIIKMRFGIQRDSECSLEQVAQEFGVGKERIRQIEAKALRKLRHPSVSAPLRRMVGEI